MIFDIRFFTLKILFGFFNIIFFSVKMDDFLGIPATLG